MPDIGLLELVVIGLVLFLVVGPERMPELFAQVAGFIRKARNWVTEAKAAVRSQTMELKDPLVQAREVVRGTVDEATDELTGELREELKDLRETGEVLKQRPLSEIYDDMQQKQQKDDDQSQGFMQGYSGGESASKKAASDEGRS